MSHKKFYSRTEVVKILNITQLQLKSWCDLKVFPLEFVEHPTDGIFTKEEFNHKYRRDERTLGIYQVYTLWDLLRMHLFLSLKGLSGTGTLSGDTLWKKVWSCPKLFDSLKKMGMAEQHPPRDVQVTLTRVAFYVHRTEQEFVECVQYKDFDAPKENFWTIGFRDLLDRIDELFPEQVYSECKEAQKCPKCDLPITPTLLLRMRFFEDLVNKHIFCPQCNESLFITATYRVTFEEIEIIKVKAPRIEEG